MERDHRASTGHERAWRIARPAGIGAVAAVVVAILFVGSAAASPIALAKAATKYSAPYTGTGYGFAGFLTAGCGTSASAAVLPDFNLSTGIGLASVKVGSHNCGTTNSSEESIYEIGMVGPSFTTTTASHNLTANWTLHFVETLAATPGGSKPLALAECDISTYTVIEDLTNGTSMDALHAPLAFKEITTGTYSHTYSGVKVVAWLDGSFKKGHKYQFEVELEVTIVTLAGPGTNSASAALNIGSGANKATLTSVTFR